MEIILTVNGLDLHRRLSTYRLAREVSYSRVVTTLDHVEHPAPAIRRPVITFSLLPMTEQECGELYDALSGREIITAYTDPFQDAVVTKRMRLDSDLEAVFALLSVDGKRRYKGGEIQLRAL